MDHGRHFGEVRGMGPCPSMSSLGLTMDDSVVRVATHLHLGVTQCRPHLCQQCGVHLGTQGLSCRKSYDRFSRHATTNDIVKMSLAAAKIPSPLEPSGLSRSDGKHPGGGTVFLWSNMRCLVWDVPARHVGTIICSYCWDCLPQTGRRMKKLKYQDLTSSHHLVPIAIETSGILGAKAN